MHATALVEQSFSKFAAVVFTAFEFLRKVEVLDLTFSFFGYVSNRCFETLSVLETCVSFVNDNYWFTIQLHKVLIVLQVAGYFWPLLCYEVFNLSMADHELQEFDWGGLF